MGGIAVLFPGQASQAKGMGKALAERYEEAAAIFEAADKALGFSISDLCFAGEGRDLALTENLQPAVLTVSAAAWKAVQTRTGLRPDFAAGHSLGEYSAYFAAGSIEFEQAVTLVRSRGRFMQEAVPEGMGGMAAVIGLDRPTVEKICAQVGGPEQVAAVNFNGGGQIAISGLTEPLKRASALLKEAGAKRVIPLEVSAPFHSPLMAPARDRLVPLLSDINFKPPAFPIVSNVDARPNKSIERIQELLTRQVTSPVLWEDTILNLAAWGVDLLVEIGPGRVLSNLAKRMLDKVTILNVDDPDSLEKLKETLAQRRSATV